MAVFHSTTENWTFCERTIMKTDIDIETEIGYSYSFKTRNEFNVIDHIILPPSSTEGLFSDNIPSQVNERAHINIIEMYKQISNKYRAFVIYEDLFSTYVVLRPLKEVPGSANFVPEIARKLINIFSVIGAPQIIESSNGRSFAEKLVQELRQRIPALKIVHGNIIRQNSKHRDFKTLIQSWQMVNPSRLWHEGLLFIQVNENICNYSSSQSNTSCSSPAKIFFKANLANDLVRFVSAKNSVETVNKIWTEEELLKKIESHRFSTPSLIFLNEFVDSNYKKENIDSFNSNNSTKNKDLFKTEENSVDTADEAGYESWTEEDWPIKTESHQSPILSPIFLNDEEQNVDSFNLMNDVNEALTETVQDYIHANKCDEKKNGRDVENAVRNVRINPRRRSSRILILSKKETLNLSKLRNSVKFNKNQITSIQNPHSRYECDSCAKVFTAEGNLKRHILTHTKQTPYQCDICAKNYPSAYTLRRHVSAAHRKVYKCEICAKMFKHPSWLTSHELIHSDKRHFQCHLCEQRFKRKMDRDSHLVTHSDSRPFKCDMCKCIFKRKNSLWYHIVNSHADTRPFECDICKATFKRKQTLQYHVTSVHENIRPFNCGVCKTTFKHKHRLRYHIASVHENKKPFKCNICKNILTTNQGLQRHTVRFHMT